MEQWEEVLDNLTISSQFPEVQKAALLETWLFLRSEVGQAPTAVDILPDDGGIMLDFGDPTTYAYILILPCGGVRWYFSSSVTEKAMSRLARNGPLDLFASLLKEIFATTHP